MRAQNIIYIILFSFSVLFPKEIWAQSSKYSRKKYSRPSKSKKASVNQKKAGDKLDISDLEQKYWAPKDTDFSVVQNRSYTKAKKVAVSLLAGPIVNDAFNSGLNGSLSVGYYFSERQGVELIYNQGFLTDSLATTTFKEKLSGGGVGPDYNRPSGYIGVAYNWVPFYAKMSFLGRKIIYFDMQFSPGIGVASYEHITDVDSNSQIEKTGKSAVALSLDITQFFFFHKRFAIRVDLKNRWYNQDVLSYRTGSKARSETENVTQILMGATFFF
ncbi:MAG: outer membrane beta-barrel domain-containing protein [Bdellovibrio sp.]|nr:MAG: outer membrane beta-barrel domain-containing protein [Bdellovibrio sp.]